MRRPKKFRGAKATPKKLERELLKNSKRLAEDPSLLLPRCQGDCRKCDFEKLRKKMEKVAGFKDDPEKLQAMASRGDQLVRAYAGTISLAASGKIPFLGTARLPSGDISYAVRGKADKEKLIGVQHFDDTDLRLLAFYDLARKKDLHLYSTKGGLVCSDRAQAPPEYVEEAVSLIPYELERGSCGHRTNATLVVEWVSAGREFRVCEDCLDEEVNLARTLGRRIAARDPMDDFRVDVDHHFEYPLGEDGSVAEDYTMGDSLAKEYLEGEINDTVLVDRYLEKKLDYIKDRGEKLYVVGNHCYGDDKSAFLERIRGSEVEKRALSALLQEKDIPVVSKSDQASKIIADLWSSHGDRLMGYVADQEDIQEAKETAGDEAPATILKEAYRIHMRKRIHAALPSFTHLGKVGKLADHLARTYKTEGKEALLRAVEKGRSRGHQMRAVNYAFLSAMGEADSKSWQFTVEEKDFGGYLSQFASRLLEAEGDDYQDALKVLVDASGAMEQVRTR
ncbi:MAG: hypothetical protein ACLFUV_02145 [Methanomassiliicoccales archaeon]